MDISNIQQQIELLNTTGYTLIVEERLRLRMQRTRIMKDNVELDQVKFWGKIQGLTNTYYILLGLKFNDSYEFPHKTFYWASEDFNFKQLPELLLQHQNFNEQFNTHLFSGDINKILVNLEGDGEQEEQAPAEENDEQGDENAKKKEVEQQEDEDAKNVPKKNYTELSKLSYVVRAIENDAQVVPRDSYRMSPQHELHQNRKFCGLDENSALSYSHWLHFRAPQTQQARKNIEQAEVIFNSDFLDDLQADLPKGVWSLQLDQKRKNVNVRNMLWPGFYAFHRLNSASFGSIYIGDGVKNVDLPFML